MSILQRLAPIQPAFRIITGTPLHLYIMAGYVMVIVQTIFAPRMIVALAYDSGGVTTSTVTVWGPGSPGER